MKSYITKKHIIVEIISYVLMCASIVIGIIWSAKLPKEVATHFDAAGNADGYGSPYSFLFLPIIMLITCGISSLVLHFMPPDLWSMPVKVKPEHAVRVYRDVVWMMVGMEFCFGVFTLYSTITAYMQKMHGMLAATFIFMAVLFGIIIWCIVACVRHNR